MSTVYFGSLISTQCRFSHSQSLNLFTTCIIIPSLVPFPYSHSLLPLLLFYLLFARIFIHPCLVTLFFFCLKKNLLPFFVKSFRVFNLVMLILVLLPLPLSDFPFVLCYSFPCTLRNFSFPSLDPLQPAIVVSPFLFFRLHPFMNTSVFTLTHTFYT